MYSLGLFKFISNRKHKAISANPVSSSLSDGALGPRQAVKLISCLSASSYLFQSPISHLLSHLGLIIKTIQPQDQMSKRIIMS